jgi:hypothetical protein
LNKSVTPILRTSHLLREVRSRGIKIWMLVSIVCIVCSIVKWLYSLALVTRSDFQCFFSELMQNIREQYVGPRICDFFAAQGNDWLSWPWIIFVSWFR